jgi:capsular exopolysaccharide synthesis family protein
MSRVFDALQEAARHHGTSGTPGEAVWTELGISPTAVPKVENDAPEVKTTASKAAEAVAIEEAVETLSATPDLNETVPQAISLPETSEKIHLDKTARLIPHTADPAVVERYRMLRTKILQEREKKFFRSLVITSAGPQEGKTVTVLNLALSFAALPSFKVLVVDADMRKGTLGAWLGIDSGHPGLSNLIEGSAQLGQAIVKSDELSLHVMPRGNAQVYDLHPDQFGPYFRQLAEHYDLVLVDTPPVNLITDVQIMAASCDAILLIARAFSTTSKSLEEAVDKLQSFRVIGTVLNAGTPRRSRKYQGYY